MSASRHTDEITLQVRGQLAWVPLPRSWPPALTGGLSTRRGGVSQGRHRGLNLGSRVGDQPERIAENLRLLEDAAGINLRAAARVHMEHHATVLEVTRGGFAGTADGVMTRLRSLALAITVADCLPLFLAAEDRAVALAHCGWRGILDGIVPRAAHALAELAGQLPSSLRAWIGPGIGPCCFRVGSEVAARFPAGARTIGPGPDELYVDLPKVIRGQLIEAGLAEAQIEASGMCTSCLPDLFFSHRRDAGRSGRMLAWIALR